METCKARIQEGPRKGLGCQFPPSKENSYCGRHQRNYQYDQLKQDGNHPCRFFFRGCNNLLETTDTLTCVNCIESLCKKKELCKHIGCKYKTNGENYCKKHERDSYRDKEKEQGIRYCDIARGCFALCEIGFSRCKSCLDITNIQENERRKQRNEIHNALNEIDTTPKQICINCGKDFEKTMTRYNRPSKLCSGCNTNQSNQDAKRNTRERNYKEEKLRNIPSHYKEYVTNAFDRNYCMELQFDDFKELVQQPCYYCNHLIETEVNGIDRVNNCIGYTKENCVSCCSICNRMKLHYHPLFFIDKCKIIANDISINKEEYYKTWSEYYYESKTKKSYNGYKKQSEKVREIPFNLTKEQWDSLLYQPCYLCGYQSASGIGLDRVDNTIREYTVDNVKPCCGPCNFMKHELSLPIFMKKVELISKKWKDTSSMELIPRGINPIKEANQKIKNHVPKIRVSWKAVGVYYNVLTDLDEFYEAQKDILTKEEYDDLKSMVRSTEKEHVIPIIQTLLLKLKKRRQRSNTKPILVVE